MKILVIGSGGREHALAWRLAQSPKVSTVYVAPGNAGTATEPKLHNIAISDHQQLIAFCREQQVTFTVVGPEAPLAAGIVDDFTASGLAIFGPSRYCAQLESSKDFAKAFMARERIPTAAYQTFTDADAAHQYVNQKGAPIVIKADGLAAGKGVIVAMTLVEAHQAIDDMLLGNAMGAAGARVVIEEFLQGEEASFIVMVDGEHVLPMATSQDHKRLLDHDKGPNTGGMGAYSPAPVVSPIVHQRVMDEIILPVVKAMQAAGHPYRGFLYAGLMIDATGAPYTIEFNCRFGDPETQPIMCRLQSDLVELIQAALAGELNTVTASWSSQTAVGVVLAAAGYPQAPRKGDVISGVVTANQTGKVFHAGTALNSCNELITNGGRVLCVVGLGTDVNAAQKQAYAALEPIHFEGMQYRYDIGAKALKSADG
ncbi:phosphoribosylamine--glycine ligase [Snodgrassella communis]|uniref:Phosphoribosylamine--glycine ligase n=1 Tax=Snodgrassella communis TaxID=2946699 RepID=A0A066THJ3_9NEIS|nr:phosphoribosylamine--glycine ligase [Snodgrassella communis]KDN11683.1 Phosphoribosylamine--glycine ligase [Snodgrassella communis]KDN14325.1 Phosphoribosylamine--glycine ligase [Snodgrassella communis]PIT10469.1 phosphoribosylamine--glycine ligase [Snodgrassella communis]PIT25555.1 phosphoribosylamine--glycine ligase [Snodgrassella communis]PIT30611.1 phosphoribosylamine--glycine ligase [Snodgrassella communis]